MYVPEGTTLFIEFVHLDMPTKNPKKCKADYLRIKGSNKTKFYCGTWDKAKIREMGPWGKDYRFQISFRSKENHQGEPYQKIGEIGNSRIFFKTFPRLTHSPSK